MHKNIVAATLAALSLAAMADASAEGFYIGAGIGEASLEVDDINFDGSDTAFQIFGGYQFNPNFAVELAYVDGGTADDRIGTTQVELDTTAIVGSVLGMLPLGESFSIYGRLGFASYDVEVSGGGEDGDEDLLYGIGGALQLGETFQLRAEYEALDVSGGAFNILSLKGVFSFGS